MKVPNPPGRGKDIAEGKGVRREEESEGSRLWDSRTGERLDKDRFRRDLGGVEDAYREIMDRLEKKGGDRYDAGRAAQEEAGAPPDQ